MPERPWRARTSGSAVCPRRLDTGPRSVVDSPSCGADESMPSLPPSVCAEFRADVAGLEPARNIGFGEQPSSLDLVRGELAAGGEAVHLLRLAAQHLGELVDREEGRQRLG